MKKIKSMAFWDAIFSQNDKKYRLPANIENILNNLQNTKKVADLGSGSGELSLLLLEYGFKVDAYDISKNALKRLLFKTDNTHLTTHHVDLNTLDHLDKYDSIFMNHVLAFVEDQKTLLKLIADSINDSFILSSLFLKNKEAYTMATTKEKNISLQEDSIFNLLHELFHKVEIIEKIEVNQYASIQTIKCSQDRN